MNDYLLSVLLGIIEGLTEFLPVSSTAHLRISEALLHIDLGNGYWKMYSIVIQLGAILCLPIYFRGRIWKFLSTFPQGERGDRTILTHPLSLTMAAFVVTAIPSFLLLKIIGKNLESLKVMGAALLIGGVVMWVVDAMFGRQGEGEASREGHPNEPEEVPSRHFVAHGGPHEDATVVSALNPAARLAPAAREPAGFHPTDHMEEMNLAQSIWIGAAQILSAVFPGTSRSMSTIAAGEIAGLSRPAALEFSFFLSMPTMVVATGYQFLKAVVPHKAKEGEAFEPIVMTSERWIVLAIGFIVSFFVAWAVVAWFMSWVRRRGFAPFAIYRIIVGAAVLVWAFKTAGG
jgi:undecaprenyl-diphosphatase